MSTIEQTWAATSADSEFEDSVVPPAGWMGVVRIAGARAGVSRKNETYLAVDLKSEDGQYGWPIYKQLTTNGVVQEGKVKSAKITLRQLGVDPNTPFGQVESLLKAKVGHYYSVEQKASDRINPVTGAPYTNTEIVGVASAPAQAAPQYVTPPPIPQDGFAQTAQPGVSTFPPAVPGTAPTVVAPQAQAPAATMQQRVQAAVAQPGVDQHPFN